MPNKATSGSLVGLHVAVVWQSRLGIPCAGSGGGKEASQPKRPIATREACAWAKWLTVTTWRAFVLIVRYVKYKQRGST